MSFASNPVESPPKMFSLDITGAKNKENESPKFAAQEV
jgi:hypothetical protein